MTALSLELTFIVTPSNRLSPSPKKGADAHHLTYHERHGAVIRSEWLQNAIIVIGLLKQVGTE